MKRKTYADNFLLLFLFLKSGAGRTENKGGYRTNRATVVTLEMCSRLFQFYRWKFGLKLSTRHATMKKANIFTFVQMPYAFALDISNNLKYGLQGALSTSYSKNFVSTITGYR